MRDVRFLRCLGAALAVLAWGTMAAIAQEAETDPEEAVKSALESSRKATESSLKRISEGPCAGNFKAIPESLVLIPRESLNLLERLNVRALKQSIDTSKAEFEKLEQSIVGDKKTLQEIEDGQRAACFDWLRREFGSKIGASVAVPLGDRSITISPTLFGIFLIDKPNQIAPPGEEPQIKIIFKPAIFEDDRMTSDLEISPSYPETAVSGLTLVPQELVQGGRNMAFRNKQSIRVDATNAIEWVWRAKAESSFEAAKFDIRMNAVRVEKGKATDPPLLVAEFPITMTRRPDGPGWLERNIAALFVGCLGACTTFFTARWGIYKTHELAMERDKHQGGP